MAPRLATTASDALAERSGVRRFHTVSEAMKDWIQAASNVVLIVGIGLVIYELQQSRDLAEAQIVTDEFSRISELRAATFGESPELALNKAARDPGSLTEAEVAVLDAYYRAVILNWLGVRASRQDIGMSGNLALIVRSQTLSTFTTEPGRAWLGHMIATGFVPGEIAEIATTALESHPENQSLLRYQAIDAVRLHGAQ